MGPGHGRKLALALAVVLLRASAASGWYPYSEKYTNWQKDRPMMMAAAHNCVPSDHLTERIERFRTAGLNTVFSDNPGQHQAQRYFQAATQCHAIDGSNERFP